MIFWEAEAAWLPLRRDVALGFLFREVIANNMQVLVLKWDLKP